MNAFAFICYAFLALVLFFSFEMARYAIIGFVALVVVRIILMLMFGGGVAGGGGGQDTRKRDLFVLTVCALCLALALGYWLTLTAALSSLVGAGVAALWLVPGMRSGRRTK